MKNIPGNVISGPKRLPTMTSIFVWPRVSFKATWDLRSNFFDSLLISAAWIPADRLTPLASYITISESAIANANIGSSKPNCKPIPDVVPVIKAEWLDGIPPVSNIIPNLIFPVEKKLNIILKNWAIKQDNKLQKRTELSKKAENSDIS